MFTESQHRHFVIIILLVVVIYLAIKYRNKNMKIVNDGRGQQGRNCVYSTPLHNKAKKHLSNTSSTMSKHENSTSRKAILKCRRK